MAQKNLSEQFSQIENLANVGIISRGSEVYTLAIGSLATIEKEEACFYALRKLYSGVDRVLLEVGNARLSRPDHALERRGLDQKMDGLRMEQRIEVSLLRKENALLKTKLRSINEFLHKEIDRIKELDNK